MIKHIDDVNTTLASITGGNNALSRDLETLATEVAHLSKNSETRKPEQPEPEQISASVIGDAHMSFLASNAQDLQSSVLQVRNGVLKAVTRIEQLKTEFDDKIRVLKTHNAIDQEAQREEFKKTIDELISTKIADAETKITRVDAEVTQLDELLNDKVTKLALNGDHVNGIQREVMESLDKRLEALEVTKVSDAKAVEDCTRRAVQNEI